MISQIRAAFHDIDGACQWHLVMQKAEQWLEQLKLGRNSLRFETCRRKHDDNTTAYTRAIQGHCSRPIVNPGFFKKIIETPQGRTHAIYHSSSQQYLDKMLLNGLIAGGMGRIDGRQACYFSAALSRESKAVPGQKSCEPLLVPYVDHKWHTHTVYATDLVKALEMGQTVYRTSSYAALHFGDIAAECIARVVGHEQIFLF